MRTPPSPKPARPIVNDVAETRTRVLLLEDDEMHAELVLRAFEDAPSFELTVARLVSEARHIISSSAPDIIIADLVLPDGQGIELLGTSQSPVVIMTSQGSEAEAVRAIRAGALDYVVKTPDMFRDLPHIATRALREWRLGQAHDQSRRMLQAQYEVASVLAAANDVSAAGTAILEIVCRDTGWIMGEFWRLDSRNGVLRREAYWASDAHLAALDSDAPVPAAEASVPLGEALPGATLAGGVPISVPNLHEARPYPGRHLVRHENLRGAFGYPVEMEGQPIGVLTFYSAEIEPQDDELEAVLKVISSQVLVLVQRRDAQEERDRLQLELLEQARLAAVGETSATLGHEIANPLNGMFLASQMLQRRLARDPDADPKLVTGVERILKENRRLDRLLTEFRSVTKRQLLTRAPTDIGALIKHVLAVQSPVLKRAGVVARMELGSSLPVLDVDDAKLTQVLLNLTKNAIEAMGAEGGGLTIRASNGGASVVIEVQDTGPGIPGDLDIFAPFKTSKDAGTGLGLAVARQIAQAHSGTLEHVPGEAGATFRLVLPLATHAQNE